VPPTRKISCLAARLPTLKSIDLPYFLSRITLNPRIGLFYLEKTITIP
jgi:hypothetical protein